MVSLSIAEVRKKILILAWPAILEMILHMMVGIVDVAMVGRLGPEAIAATGLGGLIFFSTIFVFASIGIGATSLVSRHTGANQPLKAVEVAGQSLILAIFVGVVMAFLGYSFAHEILEIFSVKPEVLELSEIYLKTVMIPAPFTLFLFVGNAVFRGIGNTKLPLVIAVFTNSINIVGDYLLVFGKFGFPKLGVVGAATATATTHIVGALLLLILLIKGIDGFKLKWCHLSSFHWPTMRQLFKLAVPAGMEEAVFSFGQIASGALITKLGTIAYAANQVALSVESLSFMPGFGFAIAVTTLVGQKLGAKRPDESEVYAIEGAKLAFIIMSSIGLIFFIFPELLVRIFTKEPEVTALATLAVRIAALEQGAIALEMALAGALRGAGETRFPMFVSFFGFWIVRIPLLYIGIIILQLGLNYVWAVSVLDWLVRIVILIAFFRKGTWKKITLEEHTTSNRKFD